MWVLILTLTMTSTVGQYAAAHTHSVPGFQTESLCKTAGKEWLKTRFDGGRQSAVCVKAK